MKLHRIFDEIINEYGFNPEEPAPEAPEWEPWTVRGALEELTGRLDVTAWTREQSQVIRWMSQETVGVRVGSDEFEEG